MGNFVEGKGKKNILKVIYSNFHVFRPQRLDISAPGATLREIKFNLILSEPYCRISPSPSLSI
jgi:hypothetical protein